MNFIYTLFVGLIGIMVGVMMLATLMAIAQPRIGTLILDLSRDDKDIAQFVFGNLELDEIAKYKTCRISIRANHLKSLDNRK